jgi:hypothetical protein
LSEIPVTNDGSERAVKNAQDVAYLFYNSRENAMLVENEQTRKFPKLSKKCVNRINDE